MKFNFNINLNLGIINIFRKLIIKLILRIEKVINPKKQSSNYERKTLLELSKHYLNFYKSYLSIRLKHNKQKSLKNLSIYSINKEMGNSLFLIDIKKFTGYEGSYYLDNRSPLTMTAMQIIDNRYLKAEDSYLFDFFNKFQPRNYGEIYNLSNKNKLYNLSPNNIFMPWLHGEPIGGCNPGMFGPKHISAIRHRLLRLKNLIHNINLYGYIPSEDDIVEGYIAILDNDYRFVITAGHHRITVLKALNNLNPDNFNLVTVKYDLKRSNNHTSVNSKEINSWPGIKSGYVNAEDALELYKTFFK